MKVSSILFDQNYLPLLHFEEVLHFEHIDLYSPWCWGYKETTNIDFLCSKHHVLKTKFESNSVNPDAVIINNVDYKKYNDENDVNKVISTYFSNIKVLDLRNKYNEHSFSSQANNVNNLNYFFDFYDPSIFCDNLRLKKIFVFTSAEGDTTSLYSQLSLFEFMTRNKQKAVIVPSVKIVSPNNRVVNFDWSLYKRIPLTDYYVALNQFMKKISFSDADYIIIGVPQNIMSIGRKSDNEIGVIQFILAQMLKIDALVVNIPSNGFNESVLLDIKALLKKRYECDGVYIINSNIVYQRNEDHKNNPLYLSEVKLNASKAKNSLNCVDSFSIFDELNNNTFSKKIAKDFF